jgi:hypothetical protein
MEVKLHAFIVSALYDRGLKSMYVEEKAGERIRLSRR